MESFWEAARVEERKRKGQTYKERRAAPCLEGLRRTLLRTESHSGASGVPSSASSMHGDVAELGVGVSGCDTPWQSCIL